MKKTLPQLWVHISASIKTSALLLSLIVAGANTSFAQFGAVAHMGANTVRLNFTAGALETGTANTVGAVYRFSNANIGGTQQIDVLAQLTVLQYSTNFTTVRYSYNYDVPQATAGIENNFQPSFIFNTGSGNSTLPANTTENIFSTWRFTFVAAGTSTPVYVPVIVDILDNDGAAGTAGTAFEIRESITSITSPTSKVLATPTQETFIGNQVLGPATNQANIGVGTDYIGYYFFNNVSTITLRYNHAFRNVSATNPTTAGVANRYSSMHVGTDYPGNNNFVLTTISGTVFNDANGLNGTPLNTVDGTGTNVGGTLFATLFDNTTGNVLLTVPVNADGTYLFNGITPGNNYSVSISNVNVPVGQTTAPATTLPAGWVNTGENNSTAAGNDGTVNGIYNLGVVNANTSNINFGIEQRPTAGAGANSAVNPGGTTQVTVPANTFTNTTVSSDVTPSTVTSIRITSFPVGATTIVINGTSYTSATFPGGGVVVPTDANGNPTQTITVDPTANGAGTVSIPFVAIDNAGVESSNTGTAVLNVTAIAIGGNVFNDANGLNGTPANTVDGALYTPAGLNAVLVDNVTGLVVATTPVSGGTYNFTNLNSGNYSVQITTNTATVGATPPTVVPPTGYVNTGENNGAGAGSDGTPNGIINIGAVSTTQNQVNFGIEQRPTAGAGSNTAGNPGGTTQVTVPANTFTNTTVSSDITPGTVASIRITSFPTGATTIVINGTSYTSATFPGGGVVVPTDANGNPTQTITIDPAANGATSISIPFVAIDNAGVASSNTGTAVMNFVTPSISGTVFNDVNGLNGTPANTVDGTGTNAGGLNANLINSLGNVVATVPVNADGTYNFTNVNAGNYTVQINTTAGTVGNPAPAVVLPAGYVSTGENIGAGAGSDGTPNGTSATITVNATNTTNVNFGIEQRPTAGAGANTVGNPGGTTQVTVPANTFTNTTASSDPTPGAVTSIRITTFPVGATTIVINGTSYTSATFPGGGVVVPTDANGNPTQTITVDPTANGAGTVTISFVALDAAGVASSNTGTAVLNFVTPSISGTVFNDANGLNGTPANTVDGTGTNAGGLNANLINSLGNVVATVPVNADGTYNFTNVNAGNYTVQINTTAGTVGNPAPAVVLPAGYVATGENIGAGAGSDGTPNGISATITVNATNVTNVNYGIDRTPTSNNQTYTIATPTANTFLTLNGTGAAGSPGPLTGSDPEDLPTSGSLSTRTIQITQLTNNGNELWYNGVRITLGADGINPPSLTNPFTISNYDPSLLQIRFTGIGSTSTSFNYRFVDAAGVPSTTAATYNVNWLTVLPVNLISFQASATAQGHNIKWVTAAEINLSKYELEYSLNGNTYKNITTVAARNASTQQTYSYFQAPNDGVATYYYRLKIVEADGSFTYSNVSIINEKRAVKVSVSPNPTVDVVRATGLVAGNQVTVFDATGKKVAQQMATNNTATISLVGKSTGIYYLIVTDKNGERVAEVSVIKQ